MMTTPSSSPMTRTSVYDSILNSEWPASLDSLEGLPDAVEPRVLPYAHPGSSQAPVVRHGMVYEALGWLGSVLPGVGLAFLLAFLGYEASEWIGARMHYAPGKSPISPITLAVIFGLIIRNTVDVPKGYEPGLRFAIKSLLRLGIVILGLTLSVKALGRDVAAGIPVIACCITVALVVVTFLNRSLGLSRRLGTLIAIGTSICGVSAIVATAPIIEAEEDVTSYAVACITIFGLIALISYPFLAHAMFGASMKEAGIFLGTAIHDTSQVTGAGLAYAQQYKADAAMKTAVTVKLVRNLSMSLLIPLMAILYHRGNQGTRQVKQKWHQIVPLFVVGFVLMACIRSLGDWTLDQHGAAFGFIRSSTWVGTDPHSGLDYLAKFCVAWLLATALGAVGLGTGFAKLRGLGLKPFTVGLVAALLVGIVSTVMIKVLAALHFLS
jgi:uncharacterized integral membrane protein (TIGR00698 family)